MSSVEQVWANSCGGGGGDSETAVRPMREADQQIELGQVDELAAENALDARPDDEVASELVASLALAE